ncbi:MAG: hypothetical protein Q9195_002436 [Heterodermia aff. obscurata]
MALFLQKIEQCGDNAEVDKTLTVMYRPPEKHKRKDMRMPLVPSIVGLEQVDVELHQSPTKAYNMGEPYNSWFSSCFGWEVMLVYLGPHLRPVLGNLSPNAVGNRALDSKSWFSGVTQALPNLLAPKAKDEEGLTFTDVAPYLIVTEESLKNVSDRLPDGMEMDMTKFRPNIVLSGASSAYEEDFWAGLKITSKNYAGERQSLDLILTQNCARCRSINVDYTTGKPGAREDGKILKMMSKDRRVDPGTKYSPIFGRYAFLKPDAHTERNISIGDEAFVSETNRERTIFGQFPEGFARE